MNNPALHALLMVICFFFIWFGAGLVVNSVSKLATRLRIPAFVVSFFLLGILTNVPEIAIGLTAIWNNDPSIFAGNLLGGVIVMFLLIIPLLGFLHNGIKLPKELGRQQLIAIMIVSVTPALLTADQKIYQWEAIFFIVLYLAVAAFFSYKESLFEKLSHSFSTKKHNFLILFGKLIFGLVVVMIAANLIVNSTLFLGDYFSINPFFISLVVVSLGTNIPEISIIFRSFFLKKQDIALANYLGSAAANTLLFGILALIYGSTIYLPNHFIQRFLFLIVGSALLFVFARSKNVLTRGESAALLGLYLAFVMIELYTAFYLSL